MKLRFLRKCPPSLMDDPSKCKHNKDGRDCLALDMFSAKLKDTSKE